MSEIEKAVELKTATVSEISPEKVEIIEIDWKNRKLPHSGVTDRKGRDIEILYDAEVKEISFSERRNLWCLCHTHQKERSYLLIREDGIDSNFAVQPCCAGCCAGLNNQDGYGNGYGDDCFRHTPFDGYDFNDACKFGHCNQLMPGAWSGSCPFPAFGPYFTKQASKIEVVNSGFMVCGKKICEDKLIGIVPFDDVGFPWCCMKNKVNKFCNCCNCCGPIEGSPLCFKPWTGMQPANPEEFVEVLKKKLPHIYYPTGKDGADASQPSLDKEIPWSNRTSSHHGATARTGKDIKVLYDAEINDIPCGKKVPLCLFGCCIFDINRSYVYIREDGIEWSRSYQPCCGKKCFGCCGDEKSAGCAYEQRSMMHWDYYFFNSALKSSKFELPAIVGNVLDALGLGAVKELPLCCISSETPKLELADSSVFICGKKCKPCAMGLYMPGDGEKTIHYFPFEICPFPLCFMRNRVNKYYNCFEKCGFMTHNPIISETFEEKFRMPQIANPEEFVGVLANKFPDLYQRKKMFFQEKEQRNSIRRMSTDKLTTPETTSDASAPASQDASDNKN